MGKMKVRGESSTPDAQTLRDFVSLFCSLSPRRHMLHASHVVLWMKGSVITKGRKTPKKTELVILLFGDVGISSANDPNSR